MPPSDRFVSETTFHVRYAETDAMGVVHHTKYLVYFEEGRSDYMRQRERDYAEVEASGYYLPVSELGARLVGAAGYGQRVTVRTWIEELRSRRLTFAYEVLDAESGDVIVTGFTRHVWTDRDGKVTTMPPQWRGILDS
jgi:acyl-CoA thioester hydrolase